MNGARQNSEEQARQLVAEFLDWAEVSGSYLRGHITRLAELAISDDDRAARAATQAVFASLVEPLADSFAPRAVSLYNRMFAQMLQVWRTAEPLRLLDQRLKGFGLVSETDLIARADQLRRSPDYGRIRDSDYKLRRVIVLSRVTLGADVAITSVLIERLKRRFPKAEIILVGGGKMRELFGGDSRPTFQTLHYERSGKTVDRLLRWTDLLEIVRSLTDGLDSGVFLIVDPDSRLTQLGLLPLAGDQDYLFFPSREYGSRSRRSLAELASRWMDAVLGESDRVYPSVNLLAADRDRAGELIKRLRRGNARPVITINFGVGENPLKRIGDEFEKSLVSALIQHGATVILDRGATLDESRRADAVVAAAVSARPLKVIRADEPGLPELLRAERLDAEVVTWSGRIGLLASLIAESDLYIGYDSAGQHIAAALGVPCIAVFAGYSSPRLLHRWRPTGRAATRVVAIDTLNGEDAAHALPDCLRHVSELMSKS